MQLVISSGTGAPPKYAVPDFLALSGDNETKAAAQTIAQVLWDDLDFEREFYMIPRDTYGAIPAARSVTDVPFDRWRELGADGLLIGTVQKEGSGPEDSGAAVQRRQPAGRVLARVHRARQATRAPTPTRWPTRSTSSSARCVASRARS